MNAVPGGRIDALELARDLIRCPSVTPVDAGAQDVLAAALGGLGFTCHDLGFEAPASPPVRNLYARLGTAAPNFCFAGHTDVVPVGDEAAWTSDPFGAEVRDDRLHGRGATDMKTAIAAFAAAADRFLARRDGRFQGSISLLITGDEEGPAVNGTAKVLAWLAERGERLDACLVGEPTNPAELGDMVKIGRRGSLTGRLRVIGTQGHVAYPDLADNPIPRLIAILAALDGTELDPGTEHFQPSNLEITTIDVANPAANVIPAEARAGFNIRFNPEHTTRELTQWLEATAREAGGDFELEIGPGSDPFLTPPGRLSDVVQAAVHQVTGRTPALSTTGGTSDARFIKDHCPVVEFGLVGRTMHKVDEYCDIADIARLSAIYEAVLAGFFGRDP